MEKPQPVLTGPPNVADNEHSARQPPLGPPPLPRQRVRMRRRRRRKAPMLPGESDKSWEWTEVEVDDSNSISDKDEDDSDFEHGTTTLMQQSAYLDFSSVERMSQVD